MRPGTIQEFHHGVVTNVTDPEKRGRIKVRCQSLVGAQTELPDWIEPEDPPFAATNGAGLFLPTVNSLVELVMDVSDLGFDMMPGERFLSNPSFRWRHARQPDGLPADLQTNYPHRRGWVTPAGHKVILDDTPGAEKIIIQNKKGHLIELTPTELRIKNATLTIIDSPVQIGNGATERMILGDLFMALYNAHSHPTGVGPSGPPAVAMSATQLSQEGNKVK